MLNRIFVVDSVTLTSTGTAVSSYTPWDQTTRKLPTQVVVKATGQGAYVRLSNDNSAATNADVLVQGGDHVVLSVQGRRWVSVLSDGASSTVNVGALSTGVSGSAASLDLAFVDAGVLDPRVTFTRASGATWFNSAGNLIGVDFSTTSNTIGTGSKTFTLDATAGVDRSWAAGDTVLISDQANSANNMTGTVTSYTASTQVLVCNITSTGGSGTIASWRIGSTMPRLDYNPATLAARGLLIEEQRTNSIRNNTMQGAVAGTPGTLPTNWNVGSASGLNTNVIGTGTEAGVNYVDIQFVGTPTATSYTLFFDATSQIAALNAQTWSSSLWCKIAAGTITNITSVNNNITYRDSGGVSVQSARTAMSLTSTWTRYAQAGTATSASTAFVQFGLWFTVTIGAAIDITLRIGLPQLELGAFATSVIPTTTTALTRSADVASVNTLSPWYNQTNGTVYAEFAPAFQGSATAAGNNPGVWGATQNGLGSFNGYGVRLFAQSAFSDNINGVSRYSPSGFNTQVNIGPNVFLNLDQTYKTAFAWETSGIAGSRDGQAVVTNTNPAAAAMGTHDQLYLGRQNIAGTPTQLNGYLRRVVYYPRRLSNAELQAITA